MIVAVAEVAAIEHLGTVEQRRAPFFAGLQAFEKTRELLELREFQVFQFAQFVFATDVVGKVVALGADAGNVLTEAVELYQN